MLAPRSLFAASSKHSESALLYCEIFLRHKTLPRSAFLLRCHAGSTSLRLGLHQTDLSHIGADRLAGDLQLICQRGARSSEEDQREQGSFHPRRFLKGHMPSAIAPWYTTPTSDVWFKLKLIAAENAQIGVARILRYDDSRNAVDST
jgi:hypothetical protein